MDSVHIHVAVPRGEHAHQPDYAGSRNLARSERGNSEFHWTTDSDLFDESNHFGRNTRHELIYAQLRNIPCRDDEFCGHLAGRSVPGFANHLRNSSDEFHLRDLRRNERAGFGLYFGAGRFFGGGQELADVASGHGGGIRNSHFHGPLHFNNGLAAYGAGGREQQWREQRIYDFRFEDSMSWQTAWFTATLNQLTYILPGPAVEVGDVYLNGLIQEPSSYVLAGNQITFTAGTVIDAGDLIAIRWLPAPVPVPPGATGVTVIPPAPPETVYPSAAAVVNMSEVMNDPDLAQAFLIQRSTQGTFLNGVWQTTPVTLSGYGPIRPASAREINMLPEGDRVGEIKAFWSSQPIYGTRGTSGKGESSDILVWNGLYYRVLQVFQDQDYGFYKALATRMKAN